MALNEPLLPEFDQEAATTRLLLERVPAKDAGWKPHPKSAVARRRSRSTWRISPRGWA